MQTALKSTISAFEEMLAYETLWAMPDSSLKSISTMFHRKKVLPSELLKNESDMFEVPKLKEDVKKYREVIQWLNETLDLLNMGDLKYTVD